MSSSPWRSSRGRGASLAEVLAALSLVSLLLLVLLSALGLVQATDFRTRISPRPTLPERGEMDRGWEAVKAEVLDSRAVEETGDPACPLRLLREGGWGRLCLDPYPGASAADTARLVFRPDSGGEQEVYRPPSIRAEAGGISTLKPLVRLEEFRVQAGATPGLLFLSLGFSLDRWGGAVTETVNGSVYAGGW